jgi:hypothetical protein
MWLVATNYKKCTHFEECLFWDVAQTAATCSRWFLAREFLYPEDGGDTFL